MCTAELPNRPCRQQLWGGGQGARGTPRNVGELDLDGKSFCRLLQQPFLSPRFLVTLCLILYPRITSSLFSSLGPCGLYSGSVFPSSHVVPGPQTEAGCRRLSQRPPRSHSLPLGVFWLQGGEQGSREVERRVQVWVVRRDHMVTRWSPDSAEATPTSRDMRQAILLE